MKLQSLPPKAVAAIFSSRTVARVAALLVLCLAVFGPVSARAGDGRVLRGHLPPATALLQPLGRLPGTDSLRLAISLPLRNQNDLTNLLQRLYDPNSPDYHRYLSPGQFNEKFGPTRQDYQRVIDFARSNGFEVLATRDSRMLLDLQGKVSDVERTFHVTLRKYQHPTEARQFYAPDVEPMVEADLPIQDIAGLADYAVARPMLHIKPAEAHSALLTGSGVGGLFQGRDFRHAYAPGVNLTGAGQSVGLLELDGYKSSDITAYESLAGLPNVPLINIDVTNYTGPPGSGEGEVTIDIDMAVAMAPGLSAVYVFQAGSSVNSAVAFQDILDSMASSNQIKQFSSSWAYSGPPDPNTTTDEWFEKMGTQGQSFFQASGDGDAWINPIVVPADSPYLTSVGGTLLTMTGSGAAYASEAVWNEGNAGGWSGNETTTNVNATNDYVGSGGGVSTVYSIPYWQTNAINTTNNGSSTMRNIPDVALAGTDILFIFDGLIFEGSGTSCAAPLWAGFTAMVNQQAAAGGGPTVGFINPAIYAIGQGASYTSTFHDTTNGNNTNLYSTNLFLAVSGYDLCTGWGTPFGAALINALSPEPLVITPSAGFVSSGPFGGLFSVTNQIFTLTNIAPAALNWSLVNTSLWLSASSSNGSLVSGGTAASVIISLNAAAANLAPGSHTNTLLFSNLNDTVTQSLQFILTVSKTAPALSWANPAAITYGTALGSIQLDATANVPGGFAYTPSAGAVLGPGTNTLSVLFTPTNAADYSNATDSVSLVVTLAPIALNLQLASNAVVLSWNDPASAFTLQAAPSLTAVFTNVPGAASPFTTAISGAQQYFRLKSN
jgi:subtilase family serine protease